MMCLLVWKPEGVKLPDEVFEARIRNSDGIGIATFVKDYQVEILKFYPSGDRRAERAIKDRMNKPMVIHWRAASSGHRGQVNCHPFKVTSGLWIAHNGHFTISTASMPARSDTWFFANRVLAPVLDENPSLRGSTKFWQTIQSLLGHNKVIVIDRDLNSVRILNKSLGYDMTGGWWASNKSWEALPVVKATVNWQVRCKELVDMYCECLPCPPPPQQGTLGGLWCAADGTRHEMRCPNSAYHHLSCPMVEKHMGWVSVPSSSGNGCTING